MTDVCRPRTCEDAASLRTHLRDCSRDHHLVRCAVPRPDKAPCPFEAWYRDGLEPELIAERGPLECDCCAICRASCEEDAAR